MDAESFNRLIAEQFDSMSGQLQIAARYVLDNPREVALLSMREQARSAKVTPATMTRLAKSLGLQGYDDVRRIFSDAVRDRPGTGFAARVGTHSATQKLKGDHALAANMLTQFQSQARVLAESGSLDAIVALALRIEAARTTYCLGLRSSYGPAWNLNYTLSLAGRRSCLLDAPGAVGPDALAHATPDDILVAASVFPYTRQTLDLAGDARARGICVAAISDSPVSPLARIADLTVIVPTDSPSFMHTISPAFMVAEIIGALVAGRSGDATSQSLSAVDRQLATLRTHLKARKRS